MLKDYKKKSPELGPTPTLLDYKELAETTTRTFEKDSSYCEQVGGKSKGEAYEKELS